VTDERLHELTSRFPNCRIAVVGDYFLDKYLDFDPAFEERSIETGLAAHQVTRIRHSPGAAGSVVGNLTSLGAGEVVVIGFTGDDGEGYDLRKDLAAMGCSDEMLLRLPDRYTPTYLKPCDRSIGGIAGERDRFDTKNREMLSAEAERAIIECLRRALPNVDAVIIADQADEENCGVVTDTVRDALAKLAVEHSQVIFWVDSRRRIGRFRNMILKPNALEAVAAAMPGFDEPIDDVVILEAGSTLAELTGKPVFLTRSEHGIIVFNGSGSIRVPGVRVEGSIDPTGAGDSATAGAVLALASGAANYEAAIVANLVGSITVQQLGTTGRATVDQLPGRLDLLRNGLA